MKPIDYLQKRLDEANTKIKFHEKQKEQWVQIAKSTKMTMDEMFSKDQSKQQPINKE